jgi:hypothetical protein
MRRLYPAAVALAAAPLAFWLGRWAGTALVRAFYTLVDESAGRLLAGAVPAADGGLGALAFALAYGALHWAHVGLGQALATRRLPVGPLLALVAAVGFTLALVAAFAVVLLGVFGLAALFDLAVGPGAVVDPRDGLHEPGRRR